MKAWKPRRLSLKSLRWRCRSNWMNRRSWGKWLKCSQFMWKNRRYQLMTRRISRKITFKFLKWRKFKRCLERRSASSKIWLISHCWSLSKIRQVSWCWSIRSKIGKNWRKSALRFFKPFKILSKKRKITDLSSKILMKTQRKMRVRMMVKSSHLAYFWKKTCRIVMHAIRKMI